MLSAAYLLCALVGLSLGLLGGGGSVLMVPILVYAAGLDMKQAIATSLVLVGISSAAGAVRYHRAGHVNRRLVALFALPGIPAALMGARVTTVFDDRELLLIFGALVIVIGIVLFMKAHSGESARMDAIPVCRPNGPVSAAIGAAIGFLTGFMGVGGGFLIVPAIALLMKCSLYTAIGTSLAIICVNSLASLPGQPALNSLDPARTAVFLAVTVSGAWAGGRLASKIRAGHLQRSFAVLILGVGIYLILRNAIAS